MWTLAWPLTCGSMKAPNANKLLDIDNGSLFAKMASTLGFCCHTGGMLPLASGTLAGIQRTCSSWKGTHKWTIAQVTKLWRAHLAYGKCLKVSWLERYHSVRWSTLDEMTCHLIFQWITASLFGPCVVFTEKNKVAKNLCLRCCNQEMLLRSNPFFYYSFWVFDFYISLALALVWQVVRTKGSFGKQYTEEHWEFFFLYI